MRGHTVAKEILRHVLPASRSYNIFADLYRGVKVTYCVYGPVLLEAIGFKGIV